MYIMFRLMIALCLLFGGCLCMAQSPGLRPVWTEMLGRSPLVVICVVDEVSLVVRADKEISKTKALPNGDQLVELQNPSDFVLGRLARARVSEVIKSDGSVRPGRAINVFLPGFFTTEGRSTLAEKTKYLLFLSPLTAQKELRSALVHQTGEHSKNVPFEPTLAYVVTGADNNGAVRVNSENQQVVKEVKAAMRKPSR